MILVGGFGVVAVLVPGGIVFVGFWWVLIGLIATSAALGSFVGLLHHPHRREHASIVWKRQLWRLHVAWLVQPGILALVAVLVWTFPRHAGPLLASAVVGGIALGTLASIVSTAEWWAVFSEQVCGRRPPRPWSEFCTFAIAAAVAVAGWFVAVGGMAFCCDALDVWAEALEP